MDYESRYTPRDRVLDPEVAEEYAEVFLTEPAAWELYYSDGSMVAGTTQETWEAAPNDDVQILIWKEKTGIVRHIYGSDTYVVGGSVKTGQWMHDPTFFRMLDEVSSRSPICKGEV